MGEKKTRDDAGEGNQVMDEQDQVQLAALKVCQWIGGFCIHTRDCVAVLCW